MSATLDTATMNRLVAHIAYLQTVNHGEDSQEPNIGGAENYFLGTKDHLSKTLRFLTAQTGDFFDKGIPTHYPFYMRTPRTCLVACIKNCSEDTSKVNVYGVYKIKGMEDILQYNHEKNINLKWECMEIPEDLDRKLVNKLRSLIKNGVCHLPFPDYDQLDEEGKKARVYNGITIKNVLVPSKSSCSIS